MQSRNMKITFATLVLSSLMAVIHCTDQPTATQLQCAADAFGVRFTEFIEACGDVAVGESVRF